MSGSLVKTTISLHRLPFFCVMLTCIVSLVLMYMLTLSWKISLVVLLVALVWLPIFLLKTVSLYREYRWLALMFVLVVAQGAHLLEHSVQMLQIHVLGVSVANANGIFSIFNTEWVHFLWSTWVLLFATLFLFLFRRNPWLKVLFVASIWHAIEHSYILYESIHTGITGLPGLLAQGGAIAGGLPIIRPDLHFLYNLVVEVLLVIAYLYQIRQMQTWQTNCSNSISLALRSRNIEIGQRAYRDLSK
jgi:hypothetical protein